MIKQKNRDDTRLTDQLTLDLCHVKSFPGFQIIIWYSALTWYVLCQLSKRPPKANVDRPGRPVIPLLRLKVYIPEITSPDLLLFKKVIGAYCYRQFIFEKFVLSTQSIVITVAVTTLQLDGASSHVSTYRRRKFLSKIKIGIYTSISTKALVFFVLGFVYSSRSHIWHPGYYWSVIWLMEI